MIVSRCVSYTYYYLGGRIAFAVVLLVSAIVFATQYKKLGIFPALVCVVLIFAILIDFFTYRKVSVFVVSETNVNTLRIYPLIMWFEQYTPPSELGTEKRIRFHTSTIIFVVAILIGIIILALALAVKRSRIDAIKANKALNRIMLGMTIVLFVEFMRGLNAVLAFAELPA